MEYTTPTEIYLHFGVTDETGLKIIVRDQNNSLPNSINDFPLWNLYDETKGDSIISGKWNVDDEIAKGYIAGYSNNYAVIYIRSKLCINMDTLAVGDRIYADMTYKSQYFKSSVLTYTP